MTEALRRRAVEIDGLSFAYDERVLEPRSWTAGQSAWAAELLDDLPLGPVLELCSGAGQIGLLAVRSHDRRLVQVDVGEAACEFARLNAENAGLSDRVIVRCGPMQEVVLPDERFPLVLADPPWVPTSEVEDFPDDPVTAIDGGEQGVDVALACVDIAGHVLTPAGVCLLQLGTSEQVDEVASYVGERDDLFLHVDDVRTFERGLVVRIDRT
jgi:release factor glutamine methyltransferase